MASDVRFHKPSPLQGALAGATVANIAVAWLTWVKVGASTRNSYEVFRTAQRFNLEALDPLRFAWFMAPVATLGCFLLLSLRLVRPAAVLALIQSLLVAIVSAAVLIIGVNTGLGPILGVIAGCGGIGLAIAVFLSINSVTRP
jgi:hypothetical protein